MESLASSFSDKSIQEDIPKNGKLTGIASKIKDNCIDFHRLVQKWKSLTVEGYEKLKQITGHLLAEISKRETISNGMVVQTSSEILSGGDDDSTVEKLTQEFRTVIEEMKATVLEMAKVVQKLKSIAELVSFRAESEENSRKPHHLIFFQTLTVKRFYEVTQEITNAYMKELKLKGNFIDDIPRLNDQDSLKIISVYWTYEHYITSETESSLESILVECCREIKF